KVTGISKLIQIVVLSLLNVAGKDVLDPDKGGGLPALLGYNFSVDDTTELFGEVVQCVKKTQSEVIAAQVGLNEDPEERLQELQIVEIKQGTNADEILVRIRIINEAGRTADIMV